MLFEKFENPDKTHLIVYEAGSPVSYMVSRNIIPLQNLKNLKYKAYRYRAKLVRSEGF